MDQLEISFILRSLQDSLLVPMISEQDSGTEEWLLCKTKYCFYANKCTTLDARLYWL